MSNSHRDLPAAPWQARLDGLRERGFAEGKIGLHRAMLHLQLRPWQAALALLVFPLTASALLLLALDPWLDFWQATLAFWNNVLDMGGRISQRPLELPGITVLIPSLELSSSGPSASQCWGTLAGCAAIFLATMLRLPDRVLPLVYVLRACLLIQVSSLVVFIWHPAEFPYGLGDYVGSCLTSGVIFIFSLPWVLGLTYFVFGFSLQQKMTLVVLSLGYFVLAMPIQFLLHAYIIQHLSLLYLPLLFIAFGMFVDVFLFISIYSYAMSWKRND